MKACYGQAGKLSPRLSPLAKHRIGTLPDLRLPGPIQAKLKVGAVDDPLEHEADRVADHVLAGEAYSELSTPPRIQRLAAHPGAHSDAVPASVDAALSHPGSPLEPALTQ